MLSVSYVRGQNEKKRKEVLSRVRLRENTVQPGEKGVPPRKVGRRMIVGFWHPYWYVYAVLRHGLSGYVGGGRCYR
jgi:alpha-1,2-mannosyltransferase